MSATSTMQRRRRRMGESRAPSQTLFECQVCNRQYDRADHLERHLDSHRNVRPFRCEHCPAAFNRRDLLLRHQTNHEKNAAKGQIGHYISDRAVKACDACVLSKVKCENSRPCQRCTKKGMLCTTKSLKSTSPHATTHGSEQPPQSPITPDPDTTRQGTRDVASATIEIARTTYESEQHVYQSPIRPDPGTTQQVLGDAASATTDIADAQTLLSLCDDTYQQRRVPAFFDQIMVPENDFVGANPALPAPDLTMWLPETDWVEEIDLFNNDFGFSIGQTFESQQILDNFFAPAASTDAPVRASRSRAAIERGDEARRRSAIFEQSPWVWVPTRNQHAFSEHDGVTIDEQHIDIATPPHEPCSSNVIISDSLSQGARDRIFQLVSKTSASRIIIPSFPSADCLDKLIKVGIAKRMETDAWIHPYTFESESSRLELLVALVSAGCICFGLPSVNRTGLVLQEIVRVALQNLTERDNSAFRDLQYLQASMIWLDVGAFCGYQRKMEIAESNLLQLVTAMRRAGRYDKVAYSSIVPDLNDSVDENEHKWREWVQIESYKRLAYHLFEHDMDMALVKHRNPLHSYSEMSLPLPFSRSLWLAPSAEAWRSRILSTDDTRGLPSLRDMLKEDDPVTYLPPVIDSQVARSVYLHGVAAQIWEHSKQSALVQEDSDPSSQLWLRSRHQRMYEMLQKFPLPEEHTFPHTRALHAFLQMYLHTSVDTITRFAGKCGEEEANRAYTLLQPWSQTKDARVAIYHAGQVLRAAREVPNHQLRGQDALMTHHSIMVLWTYSMMMSDRARRTGVNTPVRPSPSVHSHSPDVFLDVLPSVNSNQVDAFIQKNVGKPCLTTVSHSRREPPGNSNPEEQVCDLRSPSQIMKIGVELLDAKHPEFERRTKPPLLRALCNLMEGLGRLR